MYRYGDGSPFPLDENFIDTLTAAVEACTSAFGPIVELDGRRERRQAARRDADRELARLTELEDAVRGALTPFGADESARPTRGADDKKASPANAVAQKLQLAAKAALAASRAQLESRVAGLEAQAHPRTAAEAITTALRPFFDGHQLPGTRWIMAWDVRGDKPRADAVATAGRLTASYTLAVEPWRSPIRVDALAEAVVLHVLKKGVFGKAKPSPLDLGKHVLVAFEQTHASHSLTLREHATRPSPGLRVTILDDGATWIALNAAGDPEGDVGMVEAGDRDGLRRLADRAYGALKDLLVRRSLADVAFAGDAVADLAEPRVVPLELLAQLTPLCRALRDKSRMAGELVLKRDVGDGRREELFVPRAQLVARFAQLPVEYRRPFEDMGLSRDSTAPGVELPTLGPGAPTIKLGSS